MSEAIEQKHYTLDDIAQMSFDEFSAANKNLLPENIDPNDLDNEQDFKDMQELLFFYESTKDIEISDIVKKENSLLKDRGSLMPIVD